VKWIYRSTSILILLAALSLPFYADYRSNGTLLDVSSIIDRVKQAVLPSSGTINGKPIDSSEEGEGSVSSTTPEGDKPEGAVTYYRWQDENGQWHFSDEPINDQSEQKHIDPNALQTISAMDADVIERANAPEVAETSSSVQPSAMPDTELSFENASKVMENAEKAAELMNQRNEALRQVIGE